MSQTLRDARRFEEGIETFIRPEDRPAFAAQMMPVLVLMMPSMPLVER